MVAGWELCFFERCGKTLRSVKRSNRFERLAETPMMMPSGCKIPRFQE